MVGLVENALVEIRDKYTPDRIIIESRWVFSVRWEERKLVDSLGLVGLRFLLHWPFRSDRLNLKDSSWMVW